MCVALLHVNSRCLSLVCLQVSELVKRYHREDITVWASVSASIMKECRRTVQRVHKESAKLLTTTWTVTTDVSTGDETGRHSNMFPQVLLPLVQHFHDCLSLSFQNSSMPYSFTMRRGVLLLLLFYSGLLPFVPLGESLLQFYLPRIFNRSVHVCSHTFTSQ